MIFINYRRDDSTATAGRLHDRLAQSFGRKNLFMDVDHIPPGVDFVNHLNRQVAACDVFIAVIGPNWLDTRNEKDERRLDAPDDFVAIEIAAALTRDIRVIPVLVDGARMPKVGDLPEPLKPLVRRQAMDVRNTHFGRDAEALIGKIREALSDKPIRANRWRVAAGVVVALLVLGWIGLFATGMPTTLLWTVQSDPRVQAEKERLAAAQAEEERKAKAAAEAEARRKAQEAEQQRLAAAQAEEERKAKAAAEAEARRKAQEAEQQRLAAAQAEEERKAKPAAEEAHGRAQLGVRFQQVTDQIAERLNISPPRGVLVAGVDDKGPAKSAGIEPGDVIVKIDGKDIKEVFDLVRIVADTPVGKQTPVIIIRKGKEATKTVTLSEASPSSALARQSAIAINSGDYDRAIATASEAMRLDPKNASAFTNRGAAYANKGEFDRAIVDYNEAIRLEPNNGFHFIDRGRTYAKKGDLDQAITDYNEAIRLNPNYAPNYAFAFTNRGAAYANKGEFDRAIADYNEAIRLYPDNAAAFNDRGVVYEKKGNNNQAIADYDEAIRVNANYTPAFCNRGRLKLRINDASGNADIAKARQLDASICR
jgi:tetratricopeptide (TPR) repeat protein